MLHIYGQDIPHDQAFIVGTRAKLEALCSMLREALDSSQPCAMEAQTADGEGFSAIVIVVGDDEIENIALPYTDKLYCGERENGDVNGLTPYQLLGRDRLRKLLGIE